jgi:hypothetical protein
MCWGSWTAARARTESALLPPPPAAATTRRRLAAAGVQLVEAAPRRDAADVALASDAYAFGRAHLGAACVAIISNDKGGAGGLAGSCQHLRTAAAPAGQCAQPPTLPPALPPTLPPAPRRAGLAPTLRYLTSLGVLTLAVSEFPRPGGSTSSRMLPARTQDHELATAARRALRWRRDAAWPGPGPGPAAAGAGAAAGGGPGRGSGCGAGASEGAAAAAGRGCGEVLGAVVEVWHNAIQV